VEGLEVRLGDAKNILVRTGLQLKGYELRLVAGPHSEITNVLNEISEQLKIQQALKKRIEETEAIIAIGVTSIREISSALEMLEEKIRILEILSVRVDLDPTQQEGIEKQLLTYRATRDTLRASIEKCNWETELLDE